MASIYYLYSNRAVFPFLSRAFLRTWAKRLLSFRELSRRNYRRFRLVRSGARISDTAEIGKAVFEGEPGLYRIGDYSWIGKVHLRARAPITIGNCVSIADGVTILTGSHDVSDPAWGHIFSPVTIEDHVWIGTGATILPGVTLGRGAVVGAAAVVAKSVAPFAIVVGNPAHPLEKRRCEDLRYNPCEFLAANRAWLIG